MTRVPPKGPFEMVARILALFAVYLAAYLLSTEIIHGRLGCTRYRIRLFHSVWHQNVFEPLFVFEQRVHTFGNTAARVGRVVEGVTR